MAEPFHLPFPMWRVQYQLQGGHRRTFPIVLVCIVALTLGFFGFRRAMLSSPLANVAALSLNGLGVFQAFLVILGGCNAVYRAMLRDFESNMIESHRLTPMTNTAVSLGYLFGATIQTMAIFSIVLIFGAILSLAVSLPVGQWVGGNLLVINGAVTLWAVVVFSGMRPAKPISPAGVLVGVSIVGNMGLMLLPGVGLMISVYSTVLGASIIFGYAGMPAAGIAAIACVSLVLTLFWIHCAAVKYRRPDLPTLNGVRGLLLLGLWMVVGTAGLVAFRELSRAAAVPREFLGDLRIQWVGTLGVSLLVALVPINGAVECRMLARRGAAMRGAADRLAPMLVVAAAVLLICGTMAVLGSPVWMNLVPFESEASRQAAWGGSTAAVRWTQTSLACLLSLAAVRAVFILGFAYFKSPKVLVGVFVTIAWAVPPFLAFAIAEGLRGYSEPLRIGQVFGYSPLGTIGAAWTELPVSALWNGLAFQAGLAAVLSLLAGRALRRATPSNGAASIVGSSTS